MKFFRPHLEFEAPLPQRTSRRMAMATWHSHVQNPQAHASMDLDVTRLLETLAVRRDAGERITLTHAFAAILGRVARAVPELRSVLRGDRIYPRKHVSLLVQVAASPERLSAHVLQRPDERSPSDIAEELNAVVARLRASPDDAYAKANAMMNALPIAVLARVLRAAGTWGYRWNLSPSLFGLADDPFGCLRLNNLGALGIDDAVGPFVDWMRSPGTCVMMRVRPTLRQEGDRIATRQTMRFGLTIDHRLGDGGGFPRVRGLIEGFLDQPESLWSSVR